MKYGDIVHKGRVKTLSCSSRVVSCAWRRACRCSSSEAAASLAASSVSSLLTSARFSAKSASSAETASSPLFSAMLFASDSTCAFSASSRARPSRMALSSSFAPSAKMQSFPNYAYNRISHWSLQDMCVQCGAFQTGSVPLSERASLPATLLSPRSPPRERLAHAPEGLILNQKN